MTLKKWKCDLCNYTFILANKKDIENVKSKHNKEEHFCDLFGHFAKNKNSCEHCAQIFMNIAKTL